jgi:Skp family chaperone for outer membrane proteins
MTISLRSLVLGSILVIGIGGEIRAQTLAAGFVDVDRAIDEYKKTKDILDTLTKKVEQERQLVRQKKRALQEKMDALESLETEPGMDRAAAVLEQLKRTREIKLQQVEIELSERTSLFQREQDMVEHMKKVDQEICREAEAVARSRNLKVVFLTKDAKIEGRTRSEVNTEILVRPVLWSDPALDLTSEILQRLNR